MRITSKAFHCDIIAFGRLAAVYYHITAIVITGNVGGYPWLELMLNQLQIVHLDALQFTKSGFHCGLSFTSKLFSIFIIAVDRGIENMFINFSDDLNLVRVAIGLKNRIRI